MKIPSGMLAARSWLPLLLLLVAVKSLIVLSLADVFFYGEELEKGTAAKAMIDGLDVPHHQLAYHYYEGGGFVVSHLCAGFFAVVGECLLAHKLVALCFNAGILIVGWNLLRRLFGRVAAIAFGLLFVFGPESYQKLSLINLGIHFESCLFTLGVLALGARILFGEPARWWNWALLGLVTGFGIYFSYQVAVVALWVGAILLLLRTREVLGLFGVCGLLGTLVGALPLLLMYLLVGEAILDIHGTALGSAGERSSSVLFREFLASIFAHGALGGRVGPFVWVGATVGALLVLLVSRDERGETSPRLRALYLLGYPALFLVVYLQSGFVIGEVKHFFYVLRLTPLWIVACAIVAGALGLSIGSENRTRRLAGVIAGILLVASGVRATTEVMATGHPRTLGQNLGVLTSTKGYSYDQYFGKVFPHFDEDLLGKLQLVEEFDEEAKGWVRADAATNLFLEAGSDLSGAYLGARELLETNAPGKIEEYSLGLGPLLVRACGWDGARATDWASAGPEPDRSRLLEALGRFGAGRHPLREALVAEVELGLSLETPGPFLRGVGRRLYRRHRVDPWGAEEFIAERPAAARAPLREGLEAERSWHTLPGG